MQFNDRQLLHGASGIYFNNRLLQTALPREVPEGIVHDALVPLDFLPISSFEQSRKPNWEGHYDGLPIFQVAMADFRGRERAFAAAYGTDYSLQLWELSTADRFDFSVDPTTENRVAWYVELPAFTWENSIGAMELKKLVAGELWVDRVYGTVIITVEYRPDGATCWLPWTEWDICSPKNTAESTTLPVGYPTELGECYKHTSEKHTSPRP